MTVGRPKLYKKSMIVNLTEDNFNKITEDAERLVLSKNSYIRMLIEDNNTLLKILERLDSIDKKIA